MKTIWQLIKKEYILFWHDKVAVTLTFIVPLFLILIFGAVFGGAGSGGSHGLRLALVNDSEAPIAQKLADTLDKSDSFRIIKSYTDNEGRTIQLDEPGLPDYIRAGNVRAALVIPQDAYTDTSSSLKLRFYYDPRNEIEMQMIQGLLQQTVFTQMPSIFLQSMQRQAVSFLGEEGGNAFNSEIASAVSRHFGVDSSDVMLPLENLNQADGLMADTDSTGGAGHFFNNILRMEKIQVAGQEIKNPQATRNVGGWAIMFLLFAVTGTSTALFDEKKSGVILRLLAAPVSRAHILWEKYLFNISLGVLQLVAMFIFGWIVYDIDIFSNMLNLLVVILFASAASTAFGMLLASISKTTAQAEGWGTFLILTMSATGGAWFPTFLMPDYIQVISKLTLVYWAMEGFMKVLWNGMGLMEIWPEIGVLVLMSIVLILVSLWRFQKGHVF